ncbi:GNAT family N-acetyltransferase [Chryseobacterium indologenes]|uniref:GNAT family N-acetyltransferase n=1 Tax=Chryseobacterium indologenes TaxID=253 RepID=UPI000F4EA560|nr:GNAT family N-acetyltransferase [Chryseobacterium indologenes]AYZ34576.1 GNAT family N-acetyltransferase [Chryseobacterium indologenes]MBF6643149.1 GNAT family N-acetyltransferase [Chryseobacterium indologenes]MBU3048325.1 GNAT family N-acetyltransferase [Chryseobacterium indologenes]MEB4759017.1 GNAT family N-acetyltransferase [Chryseobacterium indologenes]QQQ72960.1 GNAT family N-acetyltransferase [Chryseobacterium indologenes]
MIIRKGNENDLTEMKQLFAETITSICKDDYTEEQLEAWRSGAENNERWLKVIHEQFVLVAISEHTIVGFATLDQGNYLDLFFVHKNYQHQGIASQLYEQIENAARKQTERYIRSDVSKTAKSFFEKLGFYVLKEQIVPIKGIALTNFKMQKNL